MKYLHLLLFRVAAEKPIRGGSRKVAFGSGRNAVVNPERIANEDADGTLRQQKMRGVFNDTPDVGLEIGDGRPILTCAASRFTHP
jgi:hypothetical protein